MKKTLFITLLSLLAFGCGGGGGDDVAPTSQVATTTTVPASTGTEPSQDVVQIIQGQKKTFEFPNFSNASKLAVVANHQTPTATNNLSATAEVEISGLVGVVTRSLALGRSDPDQPSTDVSPCGYADACAISAVLEPQVREQDSPQVRPRFQELAEGAQRDFFLLPRFRSVTAEKVLEPNETVHCTIFAEVVDGSPVVDRTKALAVAEAFDSNNPERPGSGIYDQVRNAFGSEWNQNPPGGNDGDDKIVIMFFSPKTLGEGLFGFVSPVDGDPDGGANSNKGEIIYVNSGKSTYQTLATISHEFQHVINQNQKVNQQGLNPEGAQDENISINEGLSGLSEEICGYTYESGNELLVTVTNNYLSKPEKHEFFNFFASGLGYGQSYLFFRYVREHFGEETIRAISTDPDTGITNLDEHLAPGFPEVFRRWTIANYATNLDGNVPSIYRYPSGLKTDGTYAAGTLVGVKTFPLANNQATTSPSLGAWSATYLTVENRPGTGLRATVTPAEQSAYGVIFEQTEGLFTSFQDSSQ